METAKINKQWDSYTQPQTVERNIQILSRTNLMIIFNGNKRNRHDKVDNKIDLCNIER